MRLLAKIKLLFTYGPELDDLLRERANAKAEEKAAYERHRLQLCHKHQQESRQSIYSEKNCDYCKALKGQFRPIDQIEIDQGPKVFVAK